MLIAIQGLLQDPSLIRATGYDADPAEQQLLLRRSA